MYSNNNLCLVGNGGALVDCQYYRFPHVPEQHFAEQLTRMDQVRPNSNLYYLITLKALTLPAVSHYFT